MLFCIWAFYTITVTRDRRSYLVESQIDILKDYSLYFNYGTYHNGDLFTTNDNIKITLSNVQIKQNLS